MVLTTNLKERYKRNLLLKEIGLEGQEKLLASKVLIIGAGGLGSPAGYYLAAAGVGKLGLVDSDRVDVSNLQRQILHFTGDLGRLKVESAREKLTDLNPDLEIEIYPDRLTPANVEGLIGNYDLVVQCVDNFETRFLVNEACIRQYKPLVEAGVLGWDGMLLTVLPGRSSCYQCVFPELPEGIPPASESGLLGVLPGVMGTLQATEALKVLLGVGELLTDRMLIYDALDLSFREVKLKRNPECPACGKD